MSDRENDPELGLRGRAMTDKNPPSIAISEKVTTNSYFPGDFQPGEVPGDLYDAIESMKKRYLRDYPDRTIGRKQKQGFFKWLKQRWAPIRFAVYLAPLAILLVIPLALLSTKFSNVTVGPGPADGNPSNLNEFQNPRVRAAGLVVWIEISVFSLWVASTVTWIIISGFNYSCEFIKRRVKTHQLLIDALKDISTNLMHLPATLVLWTVMTFATTPAICVFPEDQSPNKCGYQTGWIYILNRVFEAGIVVSFIIWVERFLIGASFISYYGKQYDHKNEVLQWDIGQIKKLFYLTLHRHPKHGHKYHVESRICKDCKAAGNPAEACLSSWEQDWNDIFASAINHEDSAEALGIYLWYAIKLDLIDPKDLAMVGEPNKLLKKDLLTKELRDWLCRDHHAFPHHKKQWITEAHEGFEQADEDTLPELDIKSYTDILNGDNDDDIQYDEMRTAVRRLGRRKQALTRTLKNVREAMESLDRPLSCLVIIAIAFVYAAFFVPNFNVYATAIFTAFTGLGFALSGTVTEFLGSCIFLFVKHPYYVGDRVLINHVLLEVDRIALMTTRFSRADNGTFVQLPHNLLNTFWIENLTRSKTLKEYFTISVSAETSFDQVESIRQDLKKFVKRNSRDFVEDSARIELSSISDLTTLKLDVEVEHKFKYLDDDVHADRQVRFKKALLTFIRDYGIMPPNADPVPMGDPTRPIHNLTSSADEVVRYRRQASTDQEDRKRTFKFEADEFRKEETPRTSRAPSRVGTPFLGPR